MNASFDGGMSRESLRVRSTAESPREEGIVAYAYTGAFVLGDSLVDSGNALKLAQWYGGLPFTDLPEGAPTSDAGYFQGRFSNGYVFTDLISNKAIGLVSKPVFPFGYKDPEFGIPLAPFAGDPSGKNLNFAYGGAHILQGDEAVPELDGQTDALRDAYDGDADPNALFLVTFGGNDVRDLALTASDPVPRDQAQARMQEIAAELLHEISQMIDDGAQNIVITGIRARRWRPRCGRGIRPYCRGLEPRLGICLAGLQRDSARPGRSLDGGGDRPDARRRPDASGARRMGHDQRLGLGRQPRHRLLRDRFGGEREAGGNQRRVAAG
jgi:hypothetical protein